MCCEVDKADNLRVISSDSHFSEYTGVHPSKIKQGKLFLNDIINPRDRENVRRAICKKNSPFVYLDFSVRGRDGEEDFIHCSANNVEGTTLCRLTMVDVSRSQKNSEALKARNDEMRELIDLVNAGVCLFKVTQDMEFTALYLNQACCDMFGTTKSVYAERTYRLDELIYSKDRSAVFQAIGTAMATKKPIEMELRVKTHKSDVMWCKFVASVHHYGDDGCPVFHGVFSDITDLKLAEEDADEERDLLIRIFKNLPGPLFTAEFNAPFILDVVSSDFIRLIGYSRKEFFEDMGGDLTRLIEPEEVSAARYSFDETSKGRKEAQAMYSIRTKKGEHIIVKDRRKLVERENGELVSIGVLSDITDRN